MLRGLKKIHASTVRGNKITSARKHSALSVAELVQLCVPEFSASRPVSNTCCWNFEDHGLWSKRQGGLLPRELDRSPVGGRGGGSVGRRQSGVESGHGPCQRAVVVPILLDVRSLAFECGAADRRKKTRCQCKLCYRNL